MMETLAWLDTLAIALLLLPLFGWVPNHLFGLRPHLVETSKLLAFAWVLWSVHFMVSVRENNKEKSKKGRRVLPVAWLALVKSYLYICGELTPPPEPPAQFQPEICGVGRSNVTLKLPFPASFFIGNMLWTQVYTDDDRYTIFGLSPNTLYDVRALGATEKLEFAICTASTEPQNDIRPRRRPETIFKEALNNVIVVLDGEKTQLRKIRKDGVKKLASLRNDIDALRGKLAAKKKADERAKKRIQALRERVDQQRAELARIQNSQLQGNNMTEDSGSIDGSLDDRVACSDNSPIPATANTSDITELAREMEASYREKEIRQRGLEVSLRVWEELQRAKSYEVQKLQQRCQKLLDRIEKLKREARVATNASTTAVTDYTAKLREERNTRKQRRLRLEADFNAAITKLSS